jgi:hypothetical protein
MKKRLMRDARRANPCPTLEAAIYRRAAII